MFFTRSVLTVCLAVVVLASHAAAQTSERVLREAKRILDKKSPAQDDRGNRSQAGQEQRADGMEGTIQRYTKPAREALEKARQLAAQIPAAKDLSPFEAAKRELQSALGRLREVKTWKGGSESPTVRDLETSYRQVYQEVYAAAEPKLVEKLATVDCPPDVYKGADQQKFHADILALWKKTYPDDELLAVRFPMETAERKVEKSWREADKTWVFTDKSTLRVSVIVKTTPKVATVYPAFVNIDNLSGTADYGVWTKTGGYVVSELLVSKVPGAAR